MSPFREKNILKAYLPVISIVSGILILVLIDQLVKDKICQAGGFYLCNPGISFGLNVYSSVYWLFLSLFLFLSYLYYKQLIIKKSLTTLNKCIFILIIGGALSNGLDRLFRGCVVDFISLGWIFPPVFNLADITIFVGSFLLFISIYFKKTII
ncbi:MAG: signal peptidase II [Candidatus Moranbacteria bacterium]|nr:signal peptidase II [Candidatus Moranbacteria bacterium]